MGSAPTAIRLVAVTVLYVVGAAAGLALAFANPHVTAVWPPTGIAVAAVVLLGPGVWPAIAVGAFVANLVNGAPPETAGLIAVGNTLAPLAAGRLLRRLRFRAELDRLVDPLALVLGAGLGCMLISATLGTFALASTGAAAGSTLSSIWLVWWVGDAMGVVVLAPVLISIGRGAARWRPMRERLPEALLVFASLAVVSRAVFTSHLELGYLVFPLVAWAGLRLAPAGAAAAAVIVASVAIPSTLAGSGPFSGHSDTTNLVSLQTFNLALTLMALVLAAITEERARAQRALRDAGGALEARVEARTAQLAALNERLGEAQSLAHMGSWHWDVRADRVDWSDELHRIYGTELGSFAPTYADFLERLHPEDRERIDRAVQAAYATGEPFAFEHRIVRPDKEIRWLHGKGRVVREGAKEVVEMLGTAQDITHRVREEEALRRSEERFHALFESAADAIVLVAADGSIVLANDEAERMFGYTRDELLGERVESLVADDLRDRHRSNRAAFLAEPRRRAMGAGLDLTARRKNGSLVPVDISLAPIDTEDGPLVVAVVRDVTVRRRAEDALREAYEREREAAERLRSLDETKDALLVAVSHDLRTPLTSVLGIADTLARAEVLEDRPLTLKLVGRLAANAERLDRMLIDLLDLDRLTRGVVEPRRRPTDVAALLARVRAAVETDDRNVLVDAPPLVADLDPAQVERIVENLLVNALRHTPPGTPVWLRAERADDGVLIVVEDAGAGVPDDFKSAAFEAFRQGTPSSHSPGVGMGLALVRRFAELHGGRAWVEDRPGGGASFRVLLPDRETPAVSIATRTHSPTRSEVS